MKTSTLHSLVFMYNPVSLTRTFWIKTLMINALYSPREQE